MTTEQNKSPTVTDAMGACHHADCIIQKSTSPICGVAASSPKHRRGNDRPDRKTNLKRHSLSIRDPHKLDEHDGHRWTCSRNTGANSVTWLNEQGYTISKALEQR